MEHSVTTAIISELEKSLLAKGLKIVKLDEPVSQGYSEEWEIQDSEGWIYAGFGIKNGSYKYNLVTNDSLPFEAQSTIDWVKNEIIRAHQLA
ncbi:hypothetical protein [Kamptonema sp. UHCC 0994]|uniref:hypothetical protein n=1 Tax=Kamptonema sp. UHCC 0994 TaxID=3031329 RepID=UPI0023BADADF|nr:hypothetical protein [Kamptonema sp. UHCC 0994]MDF0556398.1 hypothetical protein [Kamptonema sp. UHCC 0994]